MPDSWIDKDELEELVGAFAPRQGRARKGSASPLRQEPPSETEAEEAVVEPEGAVEPETAAEPESTEEPEVAVELEALAEPEVAEESEVVEVAPPPLDEACDPSAVEMPSRPEFEALFELDDDEEDDEEIEELSEVLALPGEEVADLASEEELPPPLAEVVVAEALEVQPRTVPWFLDGGEEPPPLRDSSLSERDAVRALTALAEARARAERNQLLRASRPPQDKAEEVEAEEPEEVASATDPPTETPVVETPAEEPEPEEERSLFPPRAEGVGVDSAFAALHRRIAYFGESARVRLAAAGVAVCDRDGLLLYSSESGEDGTLETALLLEVSGRTDQLLGLGAGRAMQVTLDGGVWRCLIRGAGAAEHLYAGFRLGRPLEPKEIDFWTAALAEAIHPAPAHR